MKNYLRLDDIVFGDGKEAESCSLGGDSVIATHIKCFILQFLQWILRLKSPLQAYSFLLRVLR